ncbi:hypothetical protein LJC23_07020 [Desulfovibrio sp. OttesenSCG-928-I05]|nr:hypothetical protein [Desulfovibrio sp. OttesenSCG-928-I05]
MENAQVKSGGKGKSAAQNDALFSTVLDTATISEAAKDKANAAGKDKAGTYGNGHYKNETHALKAALQQISEETGTPIKGWALGQYRKAFRESGADDLTAVRDIFHNKYGIQKIEDPGETPAPPLVDPADPADPAGDPVEGAPDGELALEDNENPAAENTDGDAGTVTENETGIVPPSGDGILAGENASQDEELFAMLGNL